MKLGTEQIVSTDENLDTTGREFMDTKPMADVLAQSEDYMVYFFFALKISNAGDAVADGFYRGDEVFVHDPGCVCSIGVVSEGNTVHTQQPFEEGWIGGGNFANGVYTILGQLCRSGSSAVNHFAAM